jgi:ATP-dependent DNA helicase PIF1
MDSTLPFGGKIVVLGGDFRQVLPVVPHGSRAQIVSSSINKSFLWKHVRILPLAGNLRAAEAESSFREFLLRVGDGKEETEEDDLIRIPDEMALPWNTEMDDDANLQLLVEKIYPRLEEDGHNLDISECGILSTRNETVDSINERILSSFPGSSQTYYSNDSVVDDKLNLYPSEFLNSLTPNGLPPHRLTLKLNAPIICLRNLDPGHGICNGTRLICRGLQKNVIDAEIASGEHKGKRVFIPRIVLMTSDGYNMPFTLRRGQFPIRVAFALTINKAQGQTIPKVGIFLPDHVFCHGQLYVALSRATRSSNIKVMMKQGTLDHRDGIWTRNIVYAEALQNSN